MTKAEEILNKHLKIMDAETMIGKHGRTHKAVINAINEAINYSQCCTEYCDWCSSTKNVEVKICKKCRQGMDKHI
jgi:superoxide dismutase